MSPWILRRLAARYSPYRLAVHRWKLAMQAQKRKLQEVGETGMNEHYTTRAKFRCLGVEKRVKWNSAATGFLYTAKFSAVSEGSPENKSFWEHTPSGTIELTSILQDAFTPGEEYYVDFIAAAVPVR